MTRRVLVALFVLLPAIALAQANTSPVDGVWQITEISTTGPNPNTNSKPQPSLIIFARGHYNWIHVAGTTPRKQRAAAATPGKLTDAEKIAAFDEWQPLTANAGTFEVKGSTLTRRLTVAKNVGPMAPGANPVVQEFKVEAKTLTLSGPAPGDPSAQIRYRLTRVR